MRLLTLVFCLAVMAASVAAQIPSPASAAAMPTFEVASIRANTSGVTRQLDVQPSGRLIGTNISLYQLVRAAYGVERQEVERHLIVPGKRYPSWIESDRWDIVANGPRGAGREQVRTMLRNLLFQRFKLEAQREVREVPVYALVIARADRRLGPRLRPSSSDCPALEAAFKASGTPPSANAPLCGLRGGPADTWQRRISGTGVPLTDLLPRLFQAVDQPVVDATGLTGHFDLDLRWTPDTLARPDGVSLFTAIQDQLGLRLEARTAPMEVVVIESAERPVPE